MKKQLFLIILLVAVFLCSCGHEHEWQNATCTAPQKCATCEEVQGEPLGHNWNEATCEAPKQCSVCAEVQGDPLDHNWNEATCETPRQCSVCAEVQGEPLNHDWVGGTCTNPGTCSYCGKIQDIYGHDWQDATCTNPQRCSFCSLTNGSPLGHEVNNGVCSRCGKDVLIAEKMDVDVAYMLKNGEIIEVELPESIYGFILHDAIKDTPVFGADQLIVRTYNMSRIRATKVEFVDDRFYASPTSQFEVRKGQLYYFLRYANREVELINDLPGNLPVDQLPLEADPLFTNMYYVYGPSPETEYTLCYWDGPDYKETTLTMKYSKYLAQGSGDYRCGFNRTYEGYSIVDLSSLETGYYLTEGLLQNGLIYVDNG